jgi:hypothetical protein
MLHYKYVMCVIKIASLLSPQKQTTGYQWSADHSLTSTELEGYNRFIQCEGYVIFFKLVLLLKKVFFVLIALSEQRVQIAKRISTKF